METKTKEKTEKQNRKKNMLIQTVSWLSFLFFELDELLRIWDIELLGVIRWYFQHFSDLVLRGIFVVSSAY